MRKHIVAGNWKMNKTFDEADELISNIMDKLEKTTLDRNTQVIICPPFPFLEMTSDYSDDSYFAVGAQNVSDQESGAYTGEVSAAMLESMELDYCIVGHSERRAYYHETDEIIARKVDQLLKHNLRPIVCCGEVLEERESNRQFDVVKKQITDGLFHLTAEQFADIVIAYEPVWAIGTGKTATPEQAQEMHAFIRGLIADKYGKEVADETSILYGGSCKPGNAKELFANPDVDGGLIGGASLKADDFIAIAEAF
ncbi:MAG: triose-phosphate isomerase [Bacteroidales bacterium]|jgi:triosephosphate isomerase|nr:triose-phosphate isomerase [Bacteroidales bacterium]MBQ3982537.1 triose-phosphate isomerase [Bacteroidales bacterium]MBR3987051.1 triose-phosphate isomerase [Bacteroidales bacterium]